MVEPVDLALAAGEHVVVFGPNGAGKTTLLRALAGVPTPPGRLDAAYLPQKTHAFRGPGLFNLSLGLDQPAVERALGLASRLGVGDVLERPARVLSGGELQRLALARTLARSEPWIVLDEPLAPLDTRDRAEVAAITMEAIGERGSVIVTHDRETSTLLGDRMVVLLEHRVAQDGPLREVFALPADEAVADVLGVSNILDGIASEAEGPLLSVAVGAVEIWAHGECEIGGAVRLIIPAESITVYARTEEHTGSARNHWGGTITGVRPAASLAEVVVAVDETEIVALVTQGSIDGLGLVPGASVTLAVKAAAVRVAGQ